MPIVAVLLREENPNSEELRKELLKLNRLFRLMELVERRFRVNLTQVVDDFEAPEEDIKIQNLRELAFMAFKTYCNTVLHGDETVLQSRLDVTGQPDEFSHFGTK